MPLFAVPPPPPQPPTTVQCTTAERQAPARCQTFAFKLGRRSVDARFIGEVTLDPGSQDPVNVPAGASLLIEERAGKSSRRLFMEHGKTSYAVDGRERPFDQEGRNWLRDVLKSMPERPVPPARTSR